MAKDNIKKYYLFQLFNSLEFFAPVIVLFWQSRGLGMTQIMLLQSIYALSVIILELPTGALADYFGKRISLIFGALFSAIGFFIYGVSFKFWHFAIGEIIVGTGMAFISGADRAFIHETLLLLGREKDYRKIEGKVRAVNQTARSLASLFGGLLGSISLGLTLLVTGIANFISLLFSISFTKTKETLKREEKTEYVEIIKNSLMIIRENKRVLWLVLFFASFNSLLWTTNIFSQPYLQKLNIPVVFFGVIFFFFNLVSAIGSALVNKFETITKDKAFLIMGSVTIISLLVISIFPSVFLIPLWAIFLAFLIMNQTIVSDKTLLLIPQNRAATILSFQNLLRRLSYAIVGPILGLISDSKGILVALRVNALILLVVLGLLFLWKNFSNIKMDYEPA